MSGIVEGRGWARKDDRDSLIVAALWTPHRATADESGSCNRGVVHFFFNFVSLISKLEVHGLLIYIVMTNLVTKF